MHETGLVKSLIRKIEAIAKQNNSEKVTRVKIQLGALSNITPEHFRYHFEYASRGTRVSDANLEIEVSEYIDDMFAQEILLKGVSLQD